MVNDSIVYTATDGTKQLIIVGTNEPEIISDNVRIFDPSENGASRIKKINTPTDDLLSTKSNLFDSSPQLSAKIIQTPTPDSTIAEEIDEETDEQAEKSSNFAKHTSKFDPSMVIELNVLDKINLNLTDDSNHFELGGQHDHHALLRNIDLMHEQMNADDEPFKM